MIQIIALAFALASAPITSVAKCSELPEAQLSACRHEVERGRAYLPQEEADSLKGYTVRSSTEESLRDMSNSLRTIAWIQLTELIIAGVIVLVALVR